MNSKRDLLAALLGLILLASPAYAANDKRLQPGAPRPAISAARPAPAPVFHPAPAPVARPAPAIVHHAPAAITSVGRASMPGIQAFRPGVAVGTRPSVSTYRAMRTPPPVGGLVNTDLARRTTPPVPVRATHGVVPVRPQQIAYHPPGPPLNPIHKVPQPVSRFGYNPPRPPQYPICDEDGENCGPAPQIACDYDGDNCQPVAQSFPRVVCDGDGDNCRQLPYWDPRYGFPTYYYQPNPYQGYYNYQEPEDEEDENFNAYYLPYDAPQIVCDQDGDDCGPAPYFNEAYQPWMALPPMPVPYTLQPVYYADPDLMRVRTRLIGMDQQARMRYQSAVANHQRKQAAHFFHATRSLDGQLTRLDARLRTGAASGRRFVSAVR